MFNNYKNIIPNVNCLKNVSLSEAVPDHIPCVGKHYMLSPVYTGSNDWVSACSLLLLVLL